MCVNMTNAVNNVQCQLEDEDDDEDATSDEALSTGQEINMYQRFKKHRK